MDPHFDSTDAEHSTHYQHDDSTLATAHNDQQYQHTSHGGDSGADDQDPNKRSRACEACRGLKVRCDPDPDGLGPCRRCKKASRRCVVTAPTRKRQKKTDSRVSELERKIDALTASLQARGAAAASASGGAFTPASHGSSGSPGGAGGEDMTRTAEDRGGAGRMGSDAVASTTSFHGKLETSRTPSLPRLDATPPAAFQPPMVIAGQKRKAPAVDEKAEAASRPAQPVQSVWQRIPEGDIVERGIITLDQAADLFARYRDRMVPNLPAVIFPPSTSVSDLRKTKPILFLAVMASAGSEDNALQKIIQKELMQIFAEKVFMTGDKSLEIVQAILVAVIWYWPPEHFEELKFYQLVHAAAVMAIDIGLGKKSPSKRNSSVSLYNWQSHPQRRHAPIDPTSIECRRTWLACFFLASNTAISLRRLNLLRWSTFMSESLDILESSPDAAPSDRYLCYLVWTHKLAEEVSNQFSFDDPSAYVNINEARSQHVLRALERDLENKKKIIPADMWKPTLNLGYDMVNLFMHEIVLHSKTAVDQLRPPFNTDTFREGVVGSEPLSAAHINAISACISSINGIFTTFLSLDAPGIRCLPVYNFVRIAYAVVILIKMYFSSSKPDSELGKVVKKGNLRVDYYLDSLIEKFREVQAGDKCRPASKFLVVLAMLRSWFIKQCRAEDAREQQQQQQSSSVGGNPNTQSHWTEQQQQHQSTVLPTTANSPLQLLSEVATGSGGTTTKRHGFTALMRNLPQPHQPFFYDNAPTSSSPNSTTTPMSNTASGATSSSTIQQQHHHQPQQQQQQQQPQLPIFPDAPQWMSHIPVTPLDMTTLPDGTAGTTTAGSGNGSGNLDFMSSLGLGPEGIQGSSYENGAQMVMREPWFSDLFQEMPDPSTMFPF